MKKILKKCFYVGLLLFVLLATGLSFIITTTPGLYVTLRLVNFCAPGKLNVSKLNGNLLNGFSFNDMTWQDTSLHILLEQGDIQWQLSTLLKKKLEISQISFKRIAVQTLPTSSDKPKSTPPPSSFSLPKLPIEVNLKALNVDSIELDEGTPLTSLNIHHLNLKDTWRIEKLSFLYQGVAWSASLQLDNGAPYQTYAKLSLKGKTQSLQNLTGALILKGNLAQFNLEGFLKGPIELKLKGSLNQGETVSFKTDWHSGRWPLNEGLWLSSPSGNIEIQGSLNNLRAESRIAIASPIKATINDHTHYQSGKVTSKTTIQTSNGSIKSQIKVDPTQPELVSGEITTQHFDLTPYNIPFKNLSLLLTFSGHTLEELILNTHFKASYNGHPLEIEANIGHEKLFSNLKLGPNHISVRGEFPYQYHMNMLIPRPSFLHPSLKGLNTTLKGKVDLNEKGYGQLTLNVAPGSYQAPENTDLGKLNFEGGTVKAQLNDKGMGVTGQLKVDPNKRLDLKASLPEFYLSAPRGLDQTFNGQVALAVDSLSFLSQLSPDIQAVSGKLNVELSGEGQLDKPKLKGKLLLSDAALSLPKLGLTLKPITLNVKTERNQWNVAGKVQSMGEVLSITGEGPLSPYPLGKLSVKAHNFPIIKTKEYEVRISPDLKVDYQTNQVKINGVIEVPYALLKPISFDDSLSLTDDAVFVRQKKSSSKHPLNADIKVIMGDNVNIDVAGLTGELKGELRIQQEPNSSPFGVGELRVEKGKYQAYGQNLTIQEGQLLFSGGLITNPGIRVKAVRSLNNEASNFSTSGDMFDFSSTNLDTWSYGSKVQVGVEVSGRVSSPKVQLFSIPASLSQADILSMLILGRPASQAGKGGGQLLLAAISAMDLDDGTKGTQLINQLKQNLGFDFEVQSSSTYNQEANEVTESTAFVIGKSITKRLYLSYNIGLFQNDGNIISIKYLLNKFFSIQVTAGDTGSGLDVFYNHSKD